MNSYIFDQAWTAEKRRLAALCLLYDEGTMRQMASLGVATGGRCLEVGAGTGTVARWLSARVGREGQVIATDVDTRFLEDLGANVEVRSHDIVKEPLEERAFDFIHARAVLEHLPERKRVLEKLRRALKPGGLVLVEDIVMPPPATHPQVPVLTRVLKAFIAGFRAAGANPDYGLELPSDLVEAGLSDVRYEARVPVITTGTPTATFYELSLEEVRERFVAAGLLTADEVQEALNYLTSPGGLLLPPIMVAAWGAHRQ